MPKALQMPENMRLEKIILSKTVSNGMLEVDVALVFHNKQYEAALFVNNAYKAGPPVPRPLENSATVATHWMSARPKIGLTEEETNMIMDEVLSENRVKQIHFKDIWGADLIDE